MKKKKKVRLKRMYGSCTAFHDSETRTLNENRRNRLDVDSTDMTTNEKVKRCSPSNLKSRRLDVIGRAPRHDEELHCIVLEGTTEGKTKNAFCTSRIIKDARVDSNKHLENVARDGESRRGHLWQTNQRVDKIK